MARGERGVVRVLEKLEASVNAGQYYEAHQMYRTLYFRYLNQKKYNVVLELLYSGANILLDCDQQGSGTDLAILLLNALTTSQTKPCAEWIEKIAKLFARIDSDMVERETFLILAVKWSMDNKMKGHPLLHKKIAEVYWKEENFTPAHRHFLHSKDGVAYAAMLVEMHTTRGFKTEIDMFITQAVLQILCLKDKEMALDVLKEYIKLHPNLSEDQELPFPYPLLNFSCLLLKYVFKKNVKNFLLLREKFKKALKCDPDYSDHLDTIGHIWFGIPVPGNNKNPSSMLGGIIKSIIGDIGIDDDGSNSGNGGNAPDLD